MKTRPIPCRTRRYVGCRRWMTEHWWSWAGEAWADYWRCEHEQPGADDAVRG